MAFKQIEYIRAHFYDAFDFVYKLRSDQWHVITSLTHYLLHTMRLIRTARTQVPLGIISVMQCNIRGSTGSCSSLFTSGCP